MDLSADTMSTEETLSLQLYDCLCEKIGSEKTVYARRLWYNVNDDCKKTMLRNNTWNDHFFINSGSRAEGLDFKGSDLDVMMVLPTIVYNHTKSDSHLLCYDTENSYPGFCKIRINPKQVNKSQFNIFRQFGADLKFFLETAVFTDTGMLVSCDKFKQYFLSRMTSQFKCPFAFKLHGPCISSFDDSMDMAFCLKCPQWPPEASTWITRHRLSTWPLDDIITNITQEGVLFVPIGPLTEWRISFSVSEKLLIHSFNHTQLLCYVLLKFLLKEVINDVSNLQNLLCSYFMKTVVFWVSEETIMTDWTPQRLIPCFQQCLKRLLYFVKCGYCPNYFMPENNMFQNKIYGKYQRELDSFLTELYEGGMLYVVMCCKSLYGFQNDMIITKNVEGKDRGLYPLLYKEKGSFKILPITRILIRMLYVKECVPKLAMYLYLIELARYIRLFTDRTAVYNYDKRNQNLYIPYRNFVHHLLIGTAIDNVRGWLNIAMFFYCHRQFNHALQIVDFVLSECTNDKIYLESDEDIYPWKVSNDVKHFSFTKRLKMTCVFNEFTVERDSRKTYSLPLERELAADQMLDRISSKCPILENYMLKHKQVCRRLKDLVPSWSASTPVLAEYIRSMCSHYLGNRLENRRSLCRLSNLIEQSNLKSAINVLTLCILLERAVSIARSDVDTVHIFLGLFMKWCLRKNVT